jgi:hypothetical protein
MKALGAPFARTDHSTGSPDLREDVQDCAKM